jgi:hypothetical protein
VREDTSVWYVFIYISLCFVLVSCLFFAGLCVVKWLSYGDVIELYIRDGNATHKQPHDTTVLKSDSQFNAYSMRLYDTNENGDRVKFMSPRLPPPATQTMAKFVL